MEISRNSLPMKSKKTKAIMLTLRNTFLFFSLIFFTVLFSSCKRPKTKSEVVKPSFAPCVIEELDFNYFSSKSKLQFKGNGMDQKTNANIRIKKDSIIWISINVAALEGFRIMIKKDSVHILDRLKDEYLVRDYNTLSNSVGIQLNYQILQSLLLGNLMVQRSATDEVLKSDTSFCIFKQYNGSITLTNQVKTAIKKIEKVEITNGVDLLTINYLNFVPLGNYSFSSENEITLLHKQEGSEDQTTYIHIEHNKVECPEKEPNFPFNVPNKFKRK